MKPMDIDVCVKYLIDAYRVSPEKDPQSYMECLCCLNPALKDDKVTYRTVYGCFLDWWFTRRECLTNDLAHRVKRILDYYREMVRICYPCSSDLAEWFKAPYEQEIVFEGKRYDAGILWVTLENLVENGLLRTIDK